MNQHRNIVVIVLNEINAWSIAAVSVFSLVLFWIFQRPVEWLIDLLDPDEWGDY